MTNTIQTDNALLVTVPSNSIGITPVCKDGGKIIGFDITISEYGAERTETIPLPSGEYEILGLADQLTEEQARLIVGDYIDFTKKEFGLTFTPAEAMVSFLKSHSLIASTTLVLKRK